MEPQESPFIGRTTVLVGMEVNRNGEKKDMQHVIDTGLITKRTPVRMNKHYGHLEEIK